MLYIVIHHEGIIQVNKVATNNISVLKSCACMTQNWLAFICNAKK